MKTMIKKEILKRDLDLFKNLKVKELLSILEKEEMRRENLINFFYKLEDDLEDYIRYISIIYSQEVNQDRFDIEEEIYNLIDINKELYQIEREMKNILLNIDSF